jgi:hypothetical protein
MKLLKQETLSQNAVTRDAKVARRFDSNSATCSNYFKQQTRARALMLVRAYLSDKPRSAVESNPQPLSWGTYTNIFQQVQNMGLASMHMDDFVRWLNAPVEPVTES